MSSSLEKIKKDFPLHFAVFNNDAKELDGLLQQGKVNKASASKLIFLKY